jgi:hypothetical protein
MSHLRLLFSVITIAGLSLVLIACDSATGVAEEEDPAAEASGTASVTLKRSVSSDVPAAADSAVVLVRNQDNLSSVFVRLVELPDQGEEVELLFDVPNGTYYAHLVAYEYRTPPDPVHNVGPLNPLALARSNGSFEVKEGDLTRLDLTVEPIEFTVEVVEPFEAGIPDSGLLRVDVPTTFDRTFLETTRGFEFGRSANFAVSREQEFDLYDGSAYVIASETAAMNSQRIDLPPIIDWSPAEKRLPVEIAPDWHFSFPTNDDPENTDDVFFKIGVQYFYDYGSIVDDRFLGFNRVYFPNRTGAGFRIPVNDPGGNLIITFRKTANGWTTVQNAEK